MHSALSHPGATHHACSLTPHCLWGRYCCANRAPVATLRSCCSTHKMEPWRAQVPPRRARFDWLREPTTASGHPVRRIPFPRGNHQNAHDLCAGMGESALDAATAPAAVPVFNPKAAPTAPAVAPVFIITSVVKIVRPVTETEVVMIEPTTASDVASPAVEAPASSPSASPSNNPSGVFAGGESSPYIRVVAPSSSAAAPAEAATPVETPSQVRSSTSPAFTSSPLGASSQAVDTSGRVVAEPTQSQVRAVLVTTSADEPSALVASRCAASRSRRRTARTNT